MRGGEQEAGRPILSLQLGVGWFPENPGGLDRIYHDLVTYLPAAGVDVAGLVVGSSGVAAATGGTVRAFAPVNASLSKRLIAARQAIKAMIRARNPQVVAAHFALFAVPGLDLLAGRRFVVHFHGPWSAESAVEGASFHSVLLRRQIERLVYRRALRIIVLSRAFARVLVRGYGVDRKLIEVIPGGLDLARFENIGGSREARAQLGLPQDRPIILSVRRLAARMGLEDLVRAVSSLRRRHRDVLLLLAGRGAHAGPLASLIESLQLTDHVRLIGFVPDDDLARLYRAANVSVMPSANLEGFGLAAIESLAAGTPVVVTPVGGLPEVVEGLSSALVTERCGPDALAETLSGALDGGLALPDAAACRAHVRAHFTVERMAARVARVYGGLVA